MKAIKIILTLLILIPGIADIAINAQRTIKKNLEWQPGQDVKIDLNIIDSIKVMAWDTPQVKAELSVNIDHNKHNDWYILEAKSRPEALILQNSFSEKNSHFKTDISGIIYIPRNCHLFIETINGNVELTGHNGAVEIKTISGFIDVTFEPESSLNLKIKSISGKVFSNLDIQQHEKGMSLVGTNIKASVNGGDIPVSLKTISGNIYLRENQ